MARLLALGCSLLALSTCLLPRARADCGRDCAACAYRLGPRADIHPLTCKAFLPAMTACNHGHLVSVASAAEFLGVSKLSDYSASKSAITGLMEAIDAELYQAGKQGIKTTIICPSFVNTELARGIQTQNELLLPVYEAEYVASKIMDAIQKEKFYLIMPPTFRLLAFKIFLPRKMILLCLSYLKIANSLDKLTGVKKKDCNQNVLKTSSAANLIFSERKKKQLNLS